MGGGWAAKGYSAWLNAIRFLVFVQVSIRELMRQGCPDKADMPAIHRNHDVAEAMLEHTLELRPEQQHLVGRE